MEKILQFRLARFLQKGVRDEEGKRVLIFRKAWSYTPDYWALARKDVGNILFTGEEVLSIIKISENPHLLHFFRKHCHVESTLEMVGMFSKE